jgi:hypothetical protein
MSKPDSSRLNGTDDAETYSYGQLVLDRAPTRTEGRFYGTTDDESEADQ